MSNFIVIEPSLITEAQLVNSNVPENDHPVWNAATAYTVGQRVIVTTGYHLIYEALTNNTNKFPPMSPLDWVEVGPTNRFAAFDEATGTVTSRADLIDFTVSGSGHQALALSELSATSVRVTISVGGVQKYDSGTVKMQDRAIVTSWYDYAFSEISLQPEFAIEDLPVYNNAEYRIHVAFTNGIAKLGNFIIGKRSILGLSEFGATVEILDGSRKEANDFNRVMLREGKFRKRMTVNCIVTNTNTDGVARKLTQLRAKPAFYIAAKGIYDSLNVYGFPRNWSVNIPYATQSAASFDIEGL